jgi:hypothetical protein
MSDKKRTWVSIVVAFLIICVILGIAIVGSAAFWFRRHIDTQFTSEQAAVSEFESQRARFAGQQPLVEVRRHDSPAVHMRTAGTSVELQTLRVLAFDPRAGKLVRVNLPFWLLRMAPSGHWRLGSAGVRFEDEDDPHLTVADIERAGPGLLIDMVNPRDGVRVLVWTE